MFKVSENNGIPFIPRNQSAKLRTKSSSTGEEGILCFHWFEDEEEIAKYWPEPVKNYGICNYDTLVSTELMCESCPIYCKDEIEEILQKQRDQFPVLLREREDWI